MGRFTEYATRAIQRINARIAVITVSTLLGGGGAWSGYSYWQSPPKGPIKQVATGVDKSESPAPVVQTAVASLSDDQVPEATSPGSHRLMQYSAAEPPSTSPPRANRQLPPHQQRSPRRLRQRLDLRPVCRRAAGEHRPQ